MVMEAEGRERLDRRRGLPGPWPSRSACALRVFAEGLQRGPWYTGLLLL